MAVDDGGKRGARVVILINRRSITAVVVVCLHLLVIAMSVHELGTCLLARLHLFVPLAFEHSYSCEE